MKKIFCFIGLALLLQSAGWCADKLTNLPPDHWAYPYMVKAASYEVDGWWIQYADKEATRLNLAQIISGYLDYLEKNNLISKEAAVKSAEIKDVPQKNEAYAAVVRVAWQYKIMPCYRGNYFMPQRTVPIGQFAIILAKLAALSSNEAQAEEAQLVAAIKEKVLDILPASAVKRNSPVKRYEAVAALIKTTDFISSANLNVMPPKKVAAGMGLDAPRQQIMVGGSFGSLSEQSAVANGDMTYGGKVVYDAWLDGGRALEVLGEGLFYNVSYLMPSGGVWVRPQETKESKLDAQLNYKNPFINNILGGNIASSIGLRGLFLRNNIAADSSLVGFRGGLEYATVFPYAITGKLGAGVTAKVLGEDSASALGEMTSALDFGVEFSRRFSKDMIVSLTYKNDALIFNQQNVRYFNSLVLNSGWEM